MGYVIKRVAHSPEVDELDLDYADPEAQAYHSTAYQTGYGAPTQPVDLGAGRASADVLRDIQYWDEPTAFPITRVEQGWLQGEVERLGAETDDEDEEVLSHVIARSLDPSIPALPSDYFSSQRATEPEPYEPTTPVPAAPTPHVGALAEDVLAAYVTRKPGDPYITVIPKRAPATIPEMIEDLQDQIRRGSDYDPTPAHLANKATLEALKRTLAGPETTTPVVRAIGPGLAGPAIQYDLPAWSTPNMGRPPAQRIKPLGGR